MRGHVLCALLLSVCPGPRKSSVYSIIPFYVHTRITSCIVTGCVFSYASLRVVGYIGG